jgi:hypothetical protein
MALIVISRKDTRARCGRSMFVPSVAIRLHHNPVLFILSLRCPFECVSDICVVRRALWFSRPPVRFAAVARDVPPLRPPIPLIRFLRLQMDPPARTGWVRLAPSIRMTGLTSLCLSHLEIHAPPSALSAAVSCLPAVVVGWLV